MSGGTPAAALTNKQAGTAGSMHHQNTMSSDLSGKGKLAMFGGAADMGAEMQEILEY